MKTSPRSPHLLHLRQLIGLALIGFVLWLAAIGWLAVSPANAAPDGPHHGHAQIRLARMPTQLNPTPEQIDRIGPILAEEAAQHQRLRER